MGDVKFPALHDVMQYLDSRTDGAITLDSPGAPQVVVYGSRNCVGFRILSDGTRPDLASFANIDLLEIQLDDRMWSEVTFDLEDNVEEVYAVVRRIASRLQEDGQTFQASVHESLDALADILDRRAGLSAEQRIGLFGELVVLLALLNDPTVGVNAIPSWQGANKEEHDFRLPSCELEVKTTTGEVRDHWISSATQLVPTSSRPLYLVSVQITAAGPGLGWSLPELVDATSRQAGPNVSLLTDGLREFGYRPEDAALYSRRWSLRSTPATYLVDAEFPAITRESLDLLGPNVAARVGEFRYRLSLQGLNQVSGPVSFNDFPERREPDDA